MYLEQKLDEILKKLKRIEDTQKLFIPDLTKKKEVMHFLQICRQTMEKYIEEGIFIDGIHYFFDNKDNMVFIPDAIIELKQGGIRKQKVSSSEIGRSIINSIGAIQ